MPTPPLYSFMRLWIMNTRLSQRLCAVGTTESKYLLFREQVTRWAVLQDILFLGLERWKSTSRSSERSENILPPIFFIHTFILYFFFNFLYMPFLPFYANANTCGEVTRLLNKTAIQRAFFFWTRMRYKINGLPIPPNLQLTLSSML